MKTADVTKKFLAGGGVMAVAEYRMGSVDVINYRDKKTGVARSANVIKTTLEMGDKSLNLTEFVRDEKFTVESWKPPYKKGTRVLVELTSLQESKGILTGDGVVHPLED
jgi:hypothetical protein